MSDAASRAIGALQAAGFRGERLKTAFGIVMRESGGNPRAHNPNRATGDDSYGLAQINMLGSMGPARRRQFGITSNEQLYDPKVNARAMFRMSKGGKDFGAWGIGPHAYRQGAGYETIARFVNQFPGAPTHAGGTGPAARVPSSPQPPARSQPDTRGFGLALLASLIGRRRGGGDMEDRRMPGVVGPYFPQYEDGSGNTPFEGFLLTAIQRAAAQPQPQPPVTLAKPGTQLGTLQRGMGVKPGPRAQLRLPASFTGTHVTAGLGWGARSARDFMAAPGTTVGAPVDGTVVYFHPEGAQGGGSMLLRGDDGREYWLGHISGGARPGTRVRRGQRIAVVANQHVSAPHVHEDVRGV